MGEALRRLPGQISGRWDEGFQHGGTQVLDVGGRAGDGRPGTCRRASRRRLCRSAASGSAPDRVQCVFPDPPPLRQVTALRQVGGALVAVPQLRSIRLEIPWSSALGLRARARACVRVCVLSLASRVCV